MIKTERYMREEIWHMEDLLDSIREEFTREYACEEYIEEKLSKLEHDCKWLRSLFKNEG